MIPLHDTPIYAQLKAEEIDQTLARINSTFAVAADAMQRLGQGARDAFVSFDEVGSITARALTEHRATMQAQINAMHAVPAHCVPITRKPLLKKGRKK